MRAGARQIMWTNFSSQIQYKPGTNLIIKAHDNTKIINAASLVKDSGSSSITIDWGDGSEQYISNTNVTNVSHTYQANGYYILNISDDVSSWSMLKSPASQNVVAIGSIGSKIQAFQNQCLQNAIVTTDSSSQTWCGLTNEEWFDAIQQYTKDAEVVVNATSFGSYSTFIPAKTVRFTNTSTINGVWFYGSGLAWCQNLIFDNPNITIPGNYLADWTWWVQTFTELYGEKHLYFTNKTISQIKSMSNYNWNIGSAPAPIYIHGSDGTIDKNGNPV